MKQILVTNDDGYDSTGLKALVEALQPFGRVTVVAPTMEKSACGHSLTLTRPLRFVEVDDDFFKLDDGTPTDCVFLSLNKLFREDSRPDLIVSGINKGANMGEDITYSGTASAAMEGVLQGIPSIAISQVCESSCQYIDDLEYRLAKEAVAHVVQKIFDGEFPLPERKFLNINIPPIKPQECQGYKVTRAGNRFYGNDAHVHHNPRGMEYYWIGLPRLDWVQNTSGQLTDFEAIEQNCVSITPVQLDMTSYQDIKGLGSWMES